jgi:mono/diheme cytochrome c family protein
MMSSGAIVKANVLVAKNAFAILVFAGVLFAPWSIAQNSNFHNAPASAKSLKNPYEGSFKSAEAGKSLYSVHCAQCHGQNGQGTGNVPSLAKDPAQSAEQGELFWYITRGDVNNGMPSWAALPKQQRWQIISYVKSLPSSKTVAATASASHPAAQI